MVWTIDYLGDSQIVELRFSGRTSGPELKEAAASRIVFGQEKGAHKYLIDAAEMLAPKSTILDVLEIPATIYANKQMDRSSSIAVVKPTDPESHWIAQFYSNASVMRGWIVKVFSDRASAIAWLQGADQQPS